MNENEWRNLYNNLYMSYKKHFTTIRLWFWLGLFQQWKGSDQWHLFYNYKIDVWSAMLWTQANT